MSTLRTIKKLVLGETWLLPLGIAAVVAANALVVRPLATAAWHRGGGLMVLAGVLAVLVISVARGARPAAVAVAAAPVVDDEPATT
ncbi:MAG: hypothetical protein QOJ35_180 [Solirubrobacteraceae bacterium]|jgi:uncharacterized PurR-regulated membrane protein YhhQ (DUF165 family)|nr:hypothetical protein [Solirubrobacteraceae bacterium]